MFSNEDKGMHTRVTGDITNPFVSCKIIRLSSACPSLLLLVTPGSEIRTPVTVSSPHIFLRADNPGYDSYLSESCISAPQKTHTHLVTQACSLQRRRDELQQFTHRLPPICAILGNNPLPLPIWFLPASSSTSSPSISMKKSGNLKRPAVDSEDEVNESVLPFDLH